MRLVVAMIATAQAILSAGMLAILFVLPNTSIIPNVLGSRPGVSEVVGITALAILLLLALMAAALVFNDMVKRPLQPFVRTTAIAVSASVVAVALDALLAMLLPGPATTVFWPDASIILLALGYVLQGNRAR